MGVKLELRGLEEFRAALRGLPAHLRDEGAAIVLAHAEQAVREIVSGYPEKSGNLRSHVTVRPSATKFGTGAVVKSAAKHAFIFEKGTTVRRTNTGANRGRMPAADASKAFIPKAIRARQRMVRALMDLLRRAGFEVSA